MPRTAPAAVAAHLRAQDLPQPPAVEFTTLLAACQAAFDEEDLARVAARLTGAIATCDSAFDDSGATQDTVADLVFAILNHSPTDNELTVDIRGLQLAAWYRDRTSRCSTRSSTSTRSAPGTGTRKWTPPCSPTASRTGRSQRR